MTASDVVRFDLVSGGTVSFEPTVLIVERDGLPHQVCRVRGEGVEGPIDLGVTIRRAGIEIFESMWLDGDATCQDVLVPEAGVVVTGVIEIRCMGTSYRAEVEFAPVRRWTVFFVNHSHTDIGFTHQPSVVVDIHNKNLESALLLAESTAAWPDDARFRWTCESSWQVQNYLRAYPSERERLAHAVGEGSVEIEGLYIHSYFDMLSREQLVRSVGYAQRLREELGIPVTSAMISDVPGCPWSLVEILNDTGIRYLSMAPNNFMAPFLATTEMQRPFWWQGPAGGRVLVWYTGDPSWAYIEGARFGFWEGIDAVEQRLPATLAQLEVDGYPFDAIQIQLGSDNRPLRLKPAAIAREWNRRYVSPRIRIAVPSEFFRHVETRWADRLPVYSGEWQSSWSQTSLHYPHEANLSRRNHSSLDQWERLAVMADLVSESFVYPGEAITAAYEASLLFDEHSGPKGIWLSRGGGDVEQALAEGYEIFEKATLPVSVGLDNAVRSATRALASGDQPEIVLWNTLDWERDEIVEMTIPEEASGQIRGLVDDTSGQPVPSEIVDRVDGTAQLRFRATGVPGLGTRRYRVVTEGEPVQPASRAARVRAEHGGVIVENDALSVTIDDRGRITRIMASGDDRILVDEDAGWALNDLVRYRPEPHGPEAGGSFTADRRLFDGVPIAGAVIEPHVVTPSAPQWSASLDGATVVTEAVIDGLYRWESSIRLVDDWIEVDDRLRWLGKPEQQEMLYVAFPWAIADPVIRHASQYTVVDPRSQALSGSNHDFFAAQYWTSVGESSGPSVVIASTDLAMVDYGGINHLAFHRSLRPKKGHLMFRAATGQGVHQDERTRFGQDGWLQVRFAIKPSGGPIDVASAHRFGEEQVMPLRTTWLRANNPGFWTERDGSFVRLKSTTAMITALKRAENGVGYIVRVWESCGERTLCALSFPMHELVTAWRTTVVEADIGLEDIVDGSLRFELGPNEIATFHCVLGR